MVYGDGAFKDPVGKIWELADPCVAVANEAYADNMFLLSPSGSAVECVQYDNAFRVCFSDPMQGAESAKYIADNQLATKIAVIYNSSDVYSTGIYQAFAKEAETEGLEIVAAEAFTAESKTDFPYSFRKQKMRERNWYFFHSITPRQPLYSNRRQASITARSFLDVTVWTESSM